MANDIWVVFDNNILWNTQNAPDHTIFIIFFFFFFFLGGGEPSDPLVRV